MFGRGVISVQYGWAFEKAGHTVEFYVRPGRKAEFGNTLVLKMLDARKKIKGILVNENWNITLREDLDSNHNYDLIMVSVQHYQFKKAADFLADKIGKATLLIFNNFWEEPLAQTAHLPLSQLVWGFPQAGGGFDKKGVLNCSLFGIVNMGTFKTAQTQRGLAVMDLFRSSGFRIKEIEDFRSWLFAHFAFNAALHLENLKSTTGMESLIDMRTTKYWENVILNSKELIPLLKARSVDLKGNSELKAFSLPPWLLSFIMKGVIKFLPSVKQIFTGHSNVEELRSYCHDVLSKAEELKISLPRFAKDKNKFQ